MAVQFAISGVPLLKSSGVPAMDVDCCCSAEDCICDVASATPTLCNCQTADYSAYKTFGTVTVTITGTATPTAATSPGCSAPASCGSIAGTYVIACADSRDQHFRIDEFVCTSGGYDYYYSNTLRIIYNIGVTVSISVRLGSSKGRLTTGTPNPYPTLVSWAGPQPSGSGAVLYEHLWSETNPLKSRWIYDLGGTCTTDCNSSTTINSCNVTTGTVTLSTNYLSGSGSTDNVCHPSSYSVSASIAAAV